MIKLVNPWTVIGCILITLATAVFTLGCATGQRVIHEDGYTYQVDSKTFLGVPYDSTRARIEVSDEEFNQAIERTRVEEQLEHESKLRAYCRNLIYLLISAAVITGLLAIVTKSVFAWGTVAIACTAMSFALAVYARILAWTGSALVVPIISVLAALFWVERRFSLIDWIKAKVSTQ